MDYIKHISNSAHCAYMDADGIFRLHLKHRPHNLAIGKTILLYQKMKDANGNIARYITHLVTIIDPTVYHDTEENPIYPNYLYVSVIAKGKILVSSLPNWSTVSFKGHSMGGKLIGNFKEVVADPSFREVLHLEILNAFFADVPKRFQLFNPSGTWRYGYLV